MSFYNREDELAALNRRWQDGEPQFFVVWGRRRVGKTELLTQFLAGKRGFHFEASEGLERDHLADLTALLADETGSPLLRAQVLDNWRAALAALEQYVTEPTVVILDEFQWVARATPDIGSLLNTWWRTTGRNRPLFLVLSGSEVSFFETRVLSGPMYGRRTGQQQLLPFDYRAAGLFFPEWSPEDRMRAYAVCGGMPYYLEQFKAGTTIEENILRTVLYRDGVLHEEAKLLLHEQLPDASRYFSILRAIANGATRFNGIVQRTGLDNATVTQALELLRELQLVRRTYPVTIANPDRTKQTMYEIADGYLRFYFRFVLPYESRLRTNGEAERHLADVVLPRFDEFVSRPAFEDACREYVRVAEDAAAVGAWWGSVRENRLSVRRELDVVALDGAAAAIAVGSCKWSGDAVGASEDELLARLKTELPKVAAETRHYLFSFGGFTDELEERARSEPETYRLLRPRDLY